MHKVLLVLLLPIVIIWLLVGLALYILGDWKYDKTKTEITGYEIWDKIIDNHKVTIDDIGKKAWVAGEFKSNFRIIRGYHLPGTPKWPDGGITIEEVETGRMRYYYMDKVILHPDNFKKKKKVSKSQ